MTPNAHVWTIAYDNIDQAAQVREAIARLGWETGTGGKYLQLFDIAVVVRHPDGSWTFDREPFPSVFNILGCTLVGFLAGLVVAAPLIGAMVGALVGGAGTVLSVAHFGVGNDFVQEVEKQMKPGTSALFILDQAGDLPVILHTIQGLGGTVIRTNVDLERVKLIQSALAAGEKSHDSNPERPQR
jgi:uncharacterized membrane protein